MKTKLTTLLLLLISVVNYAQSIGDTFTVDNIVYKISNNTPNEVELHDGYLTTGAVTIPSTVSFQGVSYDVVKIGNTAFYENSNLTSITIPASIREIGSSPFELTSLEEIIALGTTPPTIDTYYFDTPNRDIINVTVPANAINAYLNAGWVGFASINGSSFNFEDNDFSFLINSIVENTVTVSGSSSTELVLIIPATVSFNGIQYTVTEIGNSAFRLKQLTSVTLPNTITKIDVSAFYINQLTNVTLPDGLIEIGESAFSFNQLTNIELPESITELGRGAFRRNQLENIRIPSSIEKIGDVAFLDNLITSVNVLAIIPPTITNTTFDDTSVIDLIIPSGTEEAYLAAGWTDFAGINEFDEDLTDGVLFYNITSTAPNEVQVIGGNPPSDLTIPSTVSNGVEDFTVTSIANNALSNKNLTSVVLPNTFTDTGFAAFSDNNLTSVVIPEGITTIRKQSFQNNEQLSTIDFPNSVTVIDNNAFRNNGLTQLILPANVSVVGTQAFENNPITEVTSFNTTPPSIAGSSFSNRDQITLNIPTGTTVAYETAGWTGFNFVTELEIITAPYLEDFETFTTSEDAFVAQNSWSANSGPIFWRVAPASDTTLLSSTDPDPSVNTGNHVLIETIFGNLGNITDLISPLIDLSNLNNPALTFSYHMFGNGIGSLEVLVNGKDLVFSLSGEQQASATLPYSIADIDLSAYAGQTIFVTFRGTRGANNKSSIALDNVSFDNISCFAPNALGATNITTDQAELFWTENGVANSYDIELINLTAGETLTGIPTSSGITDTTHIVTGLVRGNDYAFAVRANCDADGGSNWAGPFAIKAPLSCGDVFVDSGGLSGNYSNFENSSTTIVPETVGKVVSITFNHVDIDKSSSLGCPDALTIYNGPDNTFPVLAQSICGEESGDGGFPTDPSRVLRVGDTFTSTDPSGALTIEFVSDESLKLTGWVATINCIDPNTVVVAPKVFLQGAATNPNTGEEALMRDDLRVANLLPITSPYEDGLTTEPTVFEIEGANAIVDWVFVELRDATDNTAVVAAQSALLQRDGDVVAVDGFSPLNFLTAPDDYYISGKHRNHLAIITTNAMSLSASANTLDFTSDTSLIAGGSTAMAEVSTGVFALFSGNFNGDVEISLSDRNSVRAELGEINTYSNADADLNGAVELSDINNLLNINLGNRQQF